MLVLDPVFTFLTQASRKLHLMFDVLPLPHQVKVHFRCDAHTEIFMQVSKMNRQRKKESTNLQKEEDDMQQG